MIARELLVILALIALVLVLLYIAVVFAMRPAHAQWYSWPPAYPYEPAEVFSKHVAPRDHVATLPRHHVETPTRHHVTARPRRGVTTSKRHHVVTWSHPSTSAQDDERNAIHDRVLSFCRRYPRDGACPQPEPKP